MSLAPENECLTDKTVKRASMPDQEAKRLAALRRYDILETPPETAYDELARMALQFCGTPIALISFLDEKREWCKSRLGFELTELPRESSFGSYVLLQGDLLMVEDSTLDHRFA